MNVPETVVSGTKSVAEPLISVIMCAKNEEQNIGAAIESLIGQTYRNLEVVVIDDCSSDGTERVVRSFNDPRLTLISNTKGSIGRASARNIGVNMAKGDYITYQDADDVSYSERIERQVRHAIVAPGKLAVGSWIHVDKAGDLSILKLPLDHDSIVKGFTRITRRVTFVSATMMFPSVIAKQFLQRPKFNYFEDWDMLCRINESRKLKFCNIPEPLYRYILRKKGSKAQQDWADYNVFCRACNERRQALLPEWDSLEKFHKDTAMSRVERYKWRSMRTLLALKGWLDIRRAG